MPKGLKSLVEISAWVLFIFAWVMLINVIVQSWFYDLGAQWTMVGGAILMGCFFLSAVTVKIRGKLE
jgi:hypothetical protein